MNTTYVTIGGSVWRMPAQLEPEDRHVLPASTGECVFGIRIGTLCFLVSPLMGCEVLDKTPVTSPPNSVFWLSGIVSLRGNRVPVVDLHVILNQKVTDEKNRYLFVMGHGDNAAAVWIDHLPVLKSIRQFQAANDISALSKIQQLFVTRAYEQGGQIWFSIEFGDLFEALRCHQRIKEEYVP